MYVYKWFHIFIFNDNNTVVFYTCSGHPQQQPKPAAQPTKPNYNVAGFSSPGPQKPATSVIGNRDERGIRKKFG